MGFFNELKKKKIPSALLTFVAGMTALTIVSRMADSFMLPVVTVGGVEQISLEYPVQIPGKIAAQGTVAVYAKENLRVGSTEVEKGDLVKKGDVLFTYDMTFLDEKIEDMQMELKKLKLQYDNSKSNKELAADKKKQSIGRADRDYQDVLNAAGAAESAAYQDMMIAKQKYDSVCNNPPVIQQDTDPVFGDGTVFGEETIFGDGTAFDDGTAVGDGTEGDAGRDQASSEELMKAWEAEKEQCNLEYVMRKRAYQDAVRAGAESQKNARRQVEDARAKTETDNTLELQQLDLDESEESVQELLKVRDFGGKVLSEVDGKVSCMNVEMGSITGTNIAVMLEDFSQPFRFEGITDEKTAEYLTAGAGCNLRLKESKAYIENQKIGKVTEVISGENAPEISAETGFVKSYRVSVSVESDKVKQSERAELMLVSESKVYPKCVPLSALRGNEGEYHIFIVKEQATILGMETIARRIPVEVEEKNDTYAAVSGGFGQEAKVILGAEKVIADGERVRISEGL